MTLWGTVAILPRPKGLRNDLGPASDAGPLYRSRQRPGHGTGETRLSHFDHRTREYVTDVPVLYRKSSRPGTATSLPDNTELFEGPNFAATAKDTVTSAASGWDSGNRVLAVWATEEMCFAVMLPSTVAGKM